MSSLKMGELFAGYGGLGMGVAEVLDVELAWVSEFDKGPSKILAHRFPGVPNHGDITKIDWSQVEPVDVLTGGSPCQDLSHAGKRQGMTEGTRSNLWVAMREAIAALRPSLVVWENVRGAYSAGADSALEHCPGCMGDRRPRTVLRALGRVLGDLSDLGYDARWHGLRAADIGAPHGRFRVFLVAYPNGRRGQEGHHWSARIGASQARASGLADERRSGTLLPTPAVNDMGASYTPEEWDAWTDRMKAEHGNGNGHGKSLSIEAARLLPTPTAQDSAASGGSSPSDVTLTDAVVRTNLGEQENPRHARTAEGRPDEGLRDVREAPGPQEVRERQTRGSDGLPQAEELFPSVREHQGDGDALGARVASEGAPEVGVRGVRDERPPARTSPRPELGERRPGESADALRELSPETALAGGPSTATGGQPLVAWGQYEAAIRRWERVLGRPAPQPTELGPKGNPRLSAEFSSWMMGLPAGWVTDVPGITRNEALKALGNGVVPQQCAAALRFLLGAGEVAA